MKTIDKLIDGITMYRLLLYYLGGLLMVAIGLSLFGDLKYNPWQIVISTAVLLVATWSINKAFAYFFKAPVNPESTLITALILALIITPDLSGYNILFLLAASGLAIASKYLLTIRNKHIFNPAAIAIVLTALGPQQSASWWVGSAALLPFVIIGGVLIMRKIRRERMVVTFFVTTILATAAYAALGGANVGDVVYGMLLGSPMFFLGFVMLTEPLTAPVTANKQVWYAMLVGVLFPPQVNILSFYSSPEIALIIGNMFAYIVSPKVKLFPILKEKLAIAANTFDFVFEPGRKLAYEPGQYMEFTLDHAGADSRGSRRYFTIASSPTEEDLRVGVKFYDQGSSFKNAMLTMDADTPMAASQVAGDFVLPRDPRQKLVFIAGGIGVTPFRSMTKYLTDTHDTRPVTVLYSARTEADFAYKDVFEAARQAIGIQTYYGVTDEGATVSNNFTFNGFITADIVKQTVPDYLERIFYISGTHPMVSAMQEMLTGLGVKRSNIKVDFFPGYA